MQLCGVPMSFRSCLSALAGPARGPDPLADSCSFCSASLAPIPGRDGNSISPNASLRRSGRFLRLCIAQPILRHLLARVGLVVPRQAGGHLLQPGIVAINEHATHRAAIAIQLARIDHHLAAEDECGQVLARDIPERLLLLGVRRCRPAVPCAARVGRRARSVCRHRSSPPRAQPALWPGHRDQRGAKRKPVERELGDG